MSSSPRRRPSIREPIRARRAAAGSALAAPGPAQAPARGQGPGAAAAQGPGAARGAVTVAGDRERSGNRRVGADAANAGDAAVCRPLGSASRPWGGEHLPAADPVYAGKNAFIEKHKLVVFRLTQHWNQRKPDPRAHGLATAMGWTKYQAWRRRAPV
jgi:hypothetical protein